MDYCYRDCVNQCVKTRIEPRHCECEKHHCDCREPKHHDDCCEKKHHDDCCEKKHECKLSCEIKTSCSCHESGKKPDHDHGKKAEENPS